MEHIKIKHLSIHYDAKLGCIVYDRVLKAGSGTNNYGLTVCQSLYMPEDFMENAYKIRSKYFPETSGELSHKPTKYNSQKIRGICEICKDSIANETHHLREQNESDEKGFIEGFHKNHKANLAALCEKCHLLIHKKTEKCNERDIIDIVSSKTKENENTNDSKPSAKKVRKKTSKGYKLLDV
jgi:hypothetical protein